MELSLCLNTTLEILSETATGVPGPCLSGDRLNFYVPALACTVMGEIHLNGPQLNAGESSQAQVCFFDWPPFKALVNAALELEIRRGSDIIGFCHVHPLSS